MTLIRLSAALAAALVLSACATTADPRVAALEKRVQQLQDEKAIREVLIRYGEYLDAKDYAGYASLFASDGVWTGGFGSATGPAGIQAMLEKNLGKPEPGYINKTSFHLMTTEVVEVNGDSAKVRSRYTFFTASPDSKPVPSLAGRYLDEFVRENGVWKIKKRITHGVIPYRDGNAPPPAAPPPALTCGSAAGLDFICGPKNAEDLVRVPGTPWIIASGMTEGASLTLIDSRNGTFSAVRPQAKADATFASCATPPDPAKAITHGLNLRAGANGHSTLYAVGHGSREAIEVFDVDATGARPALTWKGCVPMPDGLAANSVASFADGSLVATVLIMPGKTFADSVAKKPTGAVYEWAPGKKAFALIRGSELPGNNGIEVSSDGKEIFVVSSGFQTIVAFSHANPTKPLRTTRPLPFTPDNVHMGEDGRLLTAGMKNDVPECGGAPSAQHSLEKLSSCPRGFMALAIDPKTMKDTLVAESPAIPTFSNATMVLTFDRQYWIGTFSGDRIAHGTLR